MTQKNPPRSLNSLLQLKGLRVQVHLGCTPEEQRIAQPVRFDVRLRFAALPEGARSDRLEDTVCYDALSGRIRAVCARRPYRLIESLAYEVFSDLRETLPSSIALELEAVKERPPIPDLLNGSSFTISEWSS